MQELGRPRPWRPAGHNQAWRNCTLNCTPTGDIYCRCQVYSILWAEVQAPASSLLPACPPPPLHHHKPEAIPVHVLGAAAMHAGRTM